MSANRNEMERSTRQAPRETSPVPDDQRGDTLKLDFAWSNVLAFISLTSLVAAIVFLTWRR